MTVPMDLCKCCRGTLYYGNRYFGYLTNLTQEWTYLYMGFNGVASTVKKFLTSKSSGRVTLTTTESGNVRVIVPIGILRVWIKYLVMNQNILLIFLQYTGWKMAINNSH